MDTSLSPDFSDSLRPEEVLPLLRTSWLGRPYYYREKVSSTNDLALQLGSQGAPHGTVVLGEEQLAGRGRLSRPWISLPGCGVYLSMILRDPMPHQDAPKATMVAALSLVRVLQKCHRLPASIKWPNDVLIHKNKVAGILTEMRAEEDAIRFLVIGVGINVNHTAFLEKPSFRCPATSIAIELERTIRRSDLLVAFLEAFESDYGRFRSQGFDSLLPELERACSTLGQSVQIESVREMISGRAVGLTAAGALRLILKDGSERVVWAGDVTQVGLGN